MSLTIRLYFTAFVAIAIWTLLGWSYYHGGVPGHHMLAREDLPLISNGWGALVLPALTLFLLFRMNKRIQKCNSELTVEELPVSVVYAFLIALIFGASLAAFFTFGYKDIPGYMLIGIFILALFRPLYRAECLLGFVLGMTYTFGAVLPTAVGAVLLVLCVLVYQLLRPACVMIGKFFLRMFFK